MDEGKSKEGAGGEASEVKEAARDGKVEAEAEPNADLDIDPRIIVRNLTTETRARLLLFYRRYWGNDDEEEEKGKKSDPSVRARHAARFDGFLDRKIIDRTMRRNALRYGRDLNVTWYDDDGVGGATRRRITLEPAPAKRKKRKRKKGEDEKANDDDDE